MGEISRDELLERGVQAVRAGHRINARILLRDYAAAAPDDALAWLWQAWVADSPGEAAAHLQKAVALDPENDSAWAGLRWVQAMATSARLTRSAPGSPIATAAVLAPAPAPAVAMSPAPVAPAKPAFDPARPFGDEPKPSAAASALAPAPAPAKPPIPVMEPPILAPAAATSIGHEDFFGASRPSMPAITPAMLKPAAPAGPALPPDIPGPTPTPSPARARQDDHDFLGGSHSNGNGSGHGHGQGSTWSQPIASSRPNDDAPLASAPASGLANGGFRIEDSAPPIPPPTDMAVKALFDGDDPSDGSVEVPTPPIDVELKARGAAARVGPGDSDWSSPTAPNGPPSGEHSTAGRSQASTPALADFENTQDFLAAVLPGDSLGGAGRSGERPRFELNGANGSNAGTVSRSGDTRPMVMIVDDSPTVCRLLSLTLLQNGFQVHTAEDGVKALQALKRVKPDLILLDVVMPLLDGHKLCKLLKNHAATKHIPIIMLSSKDGFFEKTIGRLAGCNDYLSKPFEPTHVLQKVREYLPAPVGAASGA